MILNGILDILIWLLNGIWNLLPKEISLFTLADLNSLFNEVEVFGNIFYNVNLYFPLIDVFLMGGAVILMQILSFAFHWGLKAIKLIFGK